MSTPYRLSDGNQPPVVVQGQPAPVLPPTVQPAANHGIPSQPKMSDAPPPPPPDEWALPPGWKTANRESDGRVFFYHSESGKTQWEHPNAKPTTNTTSTMLKNFGLDKQLSSYGIDKDILDKNMLDPPPPLPPNALPPGWRSARREPDGRIYYYHTETGQSTWENPSKKSGDVAGGEQSLLSAFGIDGHSSLLETAKKPSNYKCLALAALLCCLPLGLCAYWNSRKVNHYYTKGDYGRARNASNKASWYSSSGVVLGAIILLVLWAMNDWRLPAFLDNLDFNLDWH